MSIHCVNANNTNINSNSININVVHLGLNFLNVFTVSSGEYNAPRYIAYNVIRSVASLIGLGVRDAHFHINVIMV